MFYLWLRASWVSLIEGAKFVLFCLGLIGALFAFIFLMFLPLVIGINFFPDKQIVGVYQLLFIIVMVIWPFLVLAGVSGFVNSKSVDDRKF